MQVPAATWLRKHWTVLEGVEVVELAVMEVGLPEPALHPERNCALLGGRPLRRGERLRPLLESLEGGLADRLPGLDHDDRLAGARG